MGSSSRAELPAGHPFPADCNRAARATTTRVWTCTPRTAWDTADDAIAAARAGLARGHLASIDYVGESVRDAGLARRETDVFLALAGAIGRAGIPATVSFDLSHVGSVVDRDLGLRHARELAEATAPLGTAMMISAEGSDRTGLVLDLYETLAADYPHVGITLQARLHCTPDDLERVLALPGTVRLVKGSFLETDVVAWRRGSPELTANTGHRAVPIWLGGGTEPGADDLARLVELRDGPPGEAVSGAAPQELTTRLLGVAGASVTGVDLDLTRPDADALGPEVTVARVELTARSGIRHVTAGLGLGLAVAVTAGAPIRVPDAVMDRLGAPVADDDLLTPFLDRVPPAGREASIPGRHPRYEPRNLDFADGLDRWNFEGPEGYLAGVEGQSATLSSAVSPPASRPAGSALLLQAIYAEDYRGGAVTFSGEIRTSPQTEQAGLRLLVFRFPPDGGRGGPIREDRGVTVTRRTEWTRYEITAPVPGDANMIAFGIELTGPGLVALRNPALGNLAPRQAATP
jgi:hypothetical protein